MNIPQQDTSPPAPFDKPANRSTSLYVHQFHITPRQLAAVQRSIAFLKASRITDEGDLVLSVLKKLVNNTMGQ